MFFLFKGLFREKIDERVLQLQSNQYVEGRIIFLYLHIEKLYLNRTVFFNPGSAERRGFANSLLGSTKSYDLYYLECLDSSK